MNDVRLVVVFNDEILDYVLNGHQIIDGDINCDGKIDIADAVNILKIMAEDADNTSIDLNGDGKVDIADFVTTLKKMAE